MTTLPEEVHPEPGHYADRADVGYKHTLSNLQIQLIAIGGAIGVGLFLGTGARLQAVGPGLVFSYLAVGVLVYFMMRALGEMVIYRPTTGAMVSYSREFVGNRFAHLTGWIYVTLAAIAGVVEIAALAVYVEFWLPDLPGWVPSLIALLIIVGSNLFTVHAFGNIEVGATLIKVTAILLFLVAGIIIVVLTAFGALDTQASVSNLWANGLFPNGVWAAVIVMQGVVFAYSATEIVGISAGEAKDPEKVMPKAINAVIFRIGLFYLGAILVLAMLIPTQNYSGEESPFVTALKSLNIPLLAGVMNFVVLTAAISGVNATLYAASRLLHDLAGSGSAPKATLVMSRRGVPIGALLSIGGFFLLGDLLIYFTGAAAAFEIALASAAVFILFGWIAVFVSHIGFRRQVAAGRIPPVSFRMPGSPYSDYIALAVLLVLFLSMIFDLRNPTWYYSLIAAVVLLGGFNLTYEIAKRKISKKGLPEVEFVGKTEDRTVNE